MRYYLIFGRIPSLSKFEGEKLLQSFGIRDFFSTQSYISFETDRDLAIKIFNRLGGSIRLTEDLQNLSNMVLANRRINVGFSFTSNFRGDRKKILRDFTTRLKKISEEIDLKVRFIYPTQSLSVLNYGSVIHNKLLSYQGFEIFFINNEQGEVVPTRSIAIQNVKEFIIRDRDKPFVDTDMGVLPQRLARMLVNFTGLYSFGKTIWDPFCGSGNLLLEAMDLGFNVIGSDISQTYVEGCQQNLQWFADLKKLDSEFVVKRCNVANQYDIQKIKDLNRKIDAIVTEPYMGSAQTKLLTEEEARSLQNQYIRLISRFFQNLNKVGFIKSGTPVVMVVPEYKTDRGFRSIDINRLFEPFCFIEKINLHWRRQNSIISRTIAVLKTK